MNIEKISLGKIKANKSNPRVIKDHKFHKLVKSLLVLPKMLELRPIVVSNDMTILGGNMRFRALQHIAKLPENERLDILNSSNDFNIKSEAEKEKLKAYWNVFCDSPIVPIVKANELSDAEQKEFIIKDNASFGEWDFDCLANEWDVEDLNDWGVDLPTFDIDEGEEDREIIEDEAPEVDEKSEPICKKGDIWQLGRHRLMCGDSTDKECVDKLMDGKKADMVFTDPPYGMKKEADGVLNDNLNFDDLLEFNKKWIPLTFANTKENGSWYCWGIDEPLMDIYSHILKPMARENKITFRNLITWDKGHGQGQLSPDFRMYPVADEKCLFVMMGVQGFSNNADNYFEAWEPIRTYLKQERDRMGWSNADMKKMCGHSPTSGCHWFDKSQWMMPTEKEYKTWQHHANGEGFKKEYEEIKKEYEEIKKEYEEIKKEYYSTRAYYDNTHDNMNNVWNFNRTSNKERELTGGHATPKPIALCSRAIKSSSRENESVLDLFGGSGSILIACEQLNRTCYMMELDPKYCDVIITRWEKLTNQKATKIN